MSFLSENVIPGNYGKKFTTDARNHDDLVKLHNALLEIEGIKDVLFETDKFPVDFVIHTNKVVNVHTIEERVKLLNFHAISKGPFFPL